MISKEIGSFFFIGILMLNIELDYNEPFNGEYCGTCRLCIDSCPTGAINDNRTIDARKCISNRTIENRGPIPEEIIPKLGGRVYGCDLCQEVCPWNKDLKSNSHPEFTINEKVADMTLEEWQTLTEDQFNELFSKTALVRIKYPDFKRNIDAAIRSLRP
jgi:epoxyqueuosine reductase